MFEISHLDGHALVKQSLHDRVQLLKQSDMAAEARMYPPEVFERTLQNIENLVAFHCQNLKVDEPYQLRSGYSPGYDPDQLMMSQSTLGNLLHSLKEGDTQNATHYLVNLDIEIAHEAYHHRVQIKFPAAATKTYEAAQTMFENENEYEYYRDLGERGARLYSLKVIEQRVAELHAGQIPTFLQDMDTETALKAYAKLTKIIQDELRLGLAPNSQ